MRTTVKTLRKPLPIALRPPQPHVSAREASLAHARAFLIYLKHRGVLNVEEFRRTNPWPIAISQTAARRIRPVGGIKRSTRTRL